MTKIDNDIVQKRRNEILKAAAQVFAEKDYHKVTTSEIADMVGVGKGTIYRYYPSKEDLYFSILDAGLSSLNEKIENEIQVRAEVTEKLEAVCFCILNFFSKNRPFFKIFLQEEARLKEKQKQATLKHISDITATVRQLLHEGVEKKIFRELDVELSANALVGMVKAMMLVDLERENRYSVTELYNSLRTILLLGILRGEESYTN